MTHQKTMLSAAWTFAVLNYLYCDVLGLMDTTILKQVLDGTIGGVTISQGFLLAASILMEIPIAMVLLSHILGYKSNRWANICAGVIMTLVQVASLFLGSAPTVYYVFFSIIEITTTVLIARYAWRWRDPQNAVQAA